MTPDRAWSRGTSRRLSALAAVVIVLLAGGVSWLVTRPTGPQRSPSTLAAEFLGRWADGDWSGLDELVLPPTEVAHEYDRLGTALDVDSVHVDVETVDQEGDRARATFTATLALAGLGEWRYENELGLAHADGEWWVDWTPAAIHPGLGPGRQLARTRAWPDRAPILTSDGSVLVGEHEVVTMGVEPRRIDDRDELLATIERELDISPDAVVAELERPGVQPDWFVPLTSLRPAEYEAVKPAVYPVPGTVFRRTTARITPQRDQATHLVGRTGEITAELLERWGPPYVQGDVVGLSGLELVFEEQLAGLPSGEVRVVDDAGDVVSVVHRFDGEEPEPVETTLDLTVQLAAERALDGVDPPAALVAVDPATGAIRAAVSRPNGDFDRALAGRYPPGSTFKVVTAAAALEAHVGRQQFPCPGSVTVGGKAFRNAGGAVGGSLTLEAAFAESCNTAFAPLAARLGADALIVMGESFGFGAEYDLPLPVGGGRFPRPADDAELAATGIGQGRVEASPLHMATVAAAVADGAWRAPSLLAGTASGTSRPLNPDVAGALRSMMRAVVERGTGAAAEVEGRTVAGKTGSAEFGQEDPPRTHAWFVGFDGAVAVAVFVEGGGSGGEVAAPVAARFFEALG